MFHASAVFKGGDIQNFGEGGRAGGENLISGDLVTLRNHDTLGLCYYPFVVTLDRYTGSYNTLNDLSNRACVPNKTSLRFKCF